MGGGAAHGAAACLGVDAAPTWGRFKGGVCAPLLPRPPPAPWPARAGCTCCLLAQARGHAPPRRLLPAPLTHCLPPCDCLASCACAGEEADQQGGGAGDPKPAHAVAGVRGHCSCVAAQPGAAGVLGCQPWRRGGCCSEAATHCLHAAWKSTEQPPTHPAARSPLFSCFQHLQQRRGGCCTDAATGLLLCCLEIVGGPACSPTHPVLVPSMPAATTWRMLWRSCRRSWMLPGRRCSRSRRTPKRERWVPCPCAAFMHSLINSAAATRVCAADAPAVLPSALGFTRTNLRAAGCASTTPNRTGALPPCIAPCPAVFALGSEVRRRTGQRRGLAAEHVQL